MGDEHRWFGDMARNALFALGELYLNCGAAYGGASATAYGNISGRAAGGINSAYRGIAREE